MTSPKKSEPTPEQKIDICCTCQKPRIVDDDDDFDPECDPNHLRVPTIKSVQDAREKIKGAIIQTPCIKSHLSDLFCMELYLKLEMFQYTGSFKERGARYALLKLSAEKQKLGVITASAGNHAQALAHHGQLLGISVTVVMPTTSPLMKREKCIKYKANVIIHGEELVESKYFALTMAKEKGLTYINGYDQVHVLSGQGTIVLEMLEQVQNLDAIVVPVGGCGLIAGCATAVKALNPHIKVIGAQSESCQGLSESLRAGKVTKVDVKPSLADGLAVSEIGVNAFEAVKDKVDKVVSVNEGHIAVAMVRLIELEKIISEGASATALAAVISGQLDEFKGKRVGLILTGGNVDTPILSRCIDRGLAAEGRLIKLKVTLPDRPGQVTEFCRVINSVGVCIKDILHERAWIISDVFNVTIKLICETRNYVHSLELRALLLGRYDVHFVDFPQGYRPPPLF